MAWNDDGDVETVFIQGIVPLVLGIGLCFLSCLYLLGIINFRCCKRHADQVSPVVMEAGRRNRAVDASGREITRATAERAFGPVACEAQLYGMAPKERQAVLHALFSSCPTHENLRKEYKEGDKNESEHGQSSDSNRDDKLERGESISDVDTFYACAICLRDYEDKDEVLIGANCPHAFHKHCAMVWLTNPRKPKDHCPYCRKEVMTPKAMKEAALLVLGEGRVAELSVFPGSDSSSNNNNNNSEASDGNETNNNNNNNNSLQQNITNITETNSTTTSVGVPLDVEREVLGS